jgi:hypothetical protein
MFVTGHAVIGLLHVLCAMPVMASLTLVVP